MSSDTATIRVTNQDIIEGERFHPTRSPIALALKRKTMRTWVVSPGSARCPETGERVDLPDRCYWFTVDWDRNRDVSPFTFKVGI